MISFFSRLLDLLSPRLCAVCHRRLTISERMMCCTCILHLPRTHFARKPYDNEMAQKLWGLLPVERVAALFYYHPHSDESRLIYALKYGNRPDYGWQIGRLTASEMMDEGFFEGIDVIVPMPITKSRRHERGYNQCEEFARGIAELTAIPIATDIVERHSFGISQTKLNHWDRRENVKNVFHLTNGEPISNRHVLLVDDIMTTGSTIISCGSELLKAGNVKISILTIGFTKG